MRPLSSNSSQRCTSPCARSISHWYVTLVPRGTTLPLAQEWDTVELPEVGKVEVPSTVSAGVGALLAELASRAASASVASLLAARSVRVAAGRRVAAALADAYGRAVGDGECG